MATVYKLQFWLFALFCSYLSLTPAVPDTLQTYSDKLLHATGYLALFLSLSLAYAHKMSWTTRAVALFFYSIAIEILQHFIPHRGFSFADILANATGLAIGVMLTVAAKKTGLFRA